MIKKEKEYVTDYTPQEIMATVIARELQDSHTVFAGIGMPCLGAMLAKYTINPTLVIVVESGAIAPQPRRIMLSIGDNSCIERAISTTSLWRVFSDMQRGFFDVGVIGGAQVDKWGNVNSTVIGSYEKPLVRLPGSGGANDIASSVKKLLITIPLEKRRFVEHVDYITSPGYLGPGGPKERRRCGLRGGGPSAVITNKCIFRFDENGEMYLDAIYPRVKVEDVIKEVQWELKIAAKLKTVEPPTTEEVEILRSLDPLKFYLGDGLQTVDFTSYTKALIYMYETLKDRINPLLL